jgi:hypothetical protein
VTSAGDDEDEAMHDQETPAVAVEAAPRRWSPWWLVASALFVVAALAAMLRSAPGSSDGVFLQGVGVAVALGLGFAFVASAVAASRRLGPLRLSTTGVVMLAVLGAWVLLDPARSLLGGIAPDASFFLDAFVRLALSGAVVVAVLRSTLTPPWRAVPAVALAAVVVASLVQLFVLSGALTDRSVIGGILSVTGLVPIVAVAALAALTFRLARRGPGTVAVLGTSR